MDIDELKNKWKRMELRMDKLDAENHRLLELIKKNRATGAKQRLQNRYLRIVIICLLCPVWILLLRQEVSVGKILEIYYVLFFIVMAIVNGYIWHTMKQNDYNVMSVKNALIKSYEIERLCKCGKTIGYVIGLPLTLLLMYTLYKIDIEPAFIGGCVGLIIGGIVGLILEIKNKKLLKEMRIALEDELCEEED